MVRFVSDVWELVRWEAQLVKTSGKSYGSVRRAGQRNREAEKCRMADR